MANGKIMVKLTPEIMDELFKEQAVVRVRRGNITLKLSRMCMEAALDVLGEKARLKEWELIK